MSDIVERLEAEAMRLSGHSIDRGSAEAGLSAVLATEAADEIERLREALERIDQWSQAYPENIFIPPDFKKAHAALQTVGMTLDGIAGDVGRRMSEPIGKLARDALADKPAASTLPAKTDS